MKNWKWIVAGVIALLVIFFLPSLYYNLFGYGPGMMFGYGGRGGMMGGSYGYGFSPFGGLFMGLGMLLMWGIPLGILFLVVYGALALFNRNQTSAPAAPSEPKLCPSCNKTAQADWVACPYCGQSL